MPHTKIPCVVGISMLHINEKPKSKKNIMRVNGCVYMCVFMYVCVFAYVKRYVRV